MSASSDESFANDPFCISSTTSALLFSCIEGFLSASLSFAQLQLLPPVSQAVTILDFRSSIGCIPISRSLVEGIPKCVPKVRQSTTFAIVCRTVALFSSVESLSNKNGTHTHYK